MDDLLEPHEALILDSAIGLFAISGGVIPVLYASSTVWSMYLITLILVPYGVFYVARGIRNYIHNKKRLKSQSPTDTRLGNACQCALINQASHVLKISSD